MGYFSNGTEGYEYQAKYCDRCKNWRDTKKAGGPGCPIIGLHMQWNYEQFKDPVKKEALDHFIPEGKPLGNRRCLMFFDKAEVKVAKNQLGLTFPEVPRA